MINPPPHHPETIDPPWLMELVRRAFEQEMRRNLDAGCDPEEALERSMWHTFELRSNVTDPYQTGVVREEDNGT